MTSTLTITLPDQLRAVVDRAVASGAYADADDYVRTLVRRDTKDAFDLEEQAILEKLLLEGLDSGPEHEDSDAFWRDLNSEVDHLIQHQQEEFIAQ